MAFWKKSKPAPPEEAKDEVTTAESASPLLGLDLEKLKEERARLRAINAQRKASGEAATSVVASDSGFPFAQEVSATLNYEDDLRKRLDRMDTLLAERPMESLIIPDGFDLKELKKELFEVTEFIDDTKSKTGIKEPIPEMFMKIYDYRALIFKRCLLVKEWLLSLDLNAKTEAIPKALSLYYYTVEDEELDEFLIRVESKIRRLIVCNKDDAQLKVKLDRLITDLVYQSFPRARKIGLFAEKLLYEPALNYERGLEIGEIAAHVNQLPLFDQRTKELALGALVARSKRTKPRQKINFFDPEQGHSRFPVGQLINDLSFLKTIASGPAQEISKAAYARNVNLLKNIAQFAPVRRLEIHSLIALCSALGMHLDSERDVTEGTVWDLKAFKELIGRIQDILKQKNHANQVEFEFVPNSTYGFLIKATILPGFLVDLNIALDGFFEREKSAPMFASNTESGSSSFTLHLKPSVPMNKLFQR